MLAAVVPLISPCFISESTFVTTVLGIGAPPGVDGRSWLETLDLDLLFLPSGITSSSSGTASRDLFAKASVPGISP